MNIINKILRLVKSLMVPVEAELPFFVLFLLAIAFQPLWFIISSMINGDIEQVWSKFFFENFPRAVAIAYLFTLLVHITRSKLVRIVCYSFAVILLAVCLFLRCVFDKTLQPDIIMLIAETNGKETSEFFKTFLFSVGGTVTLVCVVIYVLSIFFLERWNVKLLSGRGGVE